MHGATFMAHEERSEQFDFLLKTTSILRSFEDNDAPSECDKLSWVLAKLAKCSLEAFAVDISTDEAIRAGMRVVRTLIPGLQPVSFRHSARYLGTSRLYKAPLKLGYHSYPEEQLNNYPQPFA
jgi:ribosomal protein S12 methylthiotransferase accessory factor